MNDDMAIRGMLLISVAIPTKDRPSLLGDAVKSVASQSLPGWLHVEIIVVDNSSDGSARDICDSYGTLVRYFHCPIAGVSNARNRAVCESQGELIVFLDDDEEAEPSWLINLCETLILTKADVAFGAVEPEFEIKRFELQEYAQNFYRRRIRGESGDDISGQYALLGTGNSCFVKSKCFSTATPFLDRFNNSGGEDIMLLKNLADNGRRFVWAPQAIVREKIPASRCDFEYLIMRRFRNGQTRCRILLEGAPKNNFRIAVLMAAGSLQILLGAIGVVAYSVIARSPKAKEQIMTIAAGAGKLLWFVRPKERGYI